MDSAVKQKIISEPEDYYDKEGYLVCGVCHERKQKDIEVPTSFRESGVWRAPSPCKCRLAEIKKNREYYEKLEFEKLMERLQRDGITDPEYLKFTFEFDDRRDPKLSDTCHKYVEQFKQMKANNIGILFYGDVGSGKSFMACCIANALLQKQVTVSVTNFPRILNKLQVTYNEEMKLERQRFIDRLHQYSLLVVDDLGVERDTAYSVEQIYNVIDTRLRSGKPLIITTNLSMQDLKSPSSLEYKRIYDRVLEMCPIRLKVVGESRRVEKAEDKKIQARKLLGLE